MLHLPLAALIYSALCFSRYHHPPVYPQLFLLAFFFTARDERVRFRILLFSIVLAASFKGADAFYLSLPLKQDIISSVSGFSSTESAVKENGMQFFQLELSSAKSGHGVYSSASGMVGVLGPYNPVGRGAYVRAQGYFTDAGFFYATHVETKDASFSDRLKRRVRFFLSSRLDGLEEDEAELFRLLFFGSGYDPDYHLVESGRMKGVAHVFALSGMHLSILSSFLILPLSPFLGKNRARFLTIPILFLFTWLSSFKASLFRAFCFRLVFLLFPKADSDEAVCLSFISLALFFPSSLFSAASVYSFLSLSGMFLFSPLEKAPVLRFFKPVVQSAGALSLSIPYSLMLFGEFSLAGLLFSFPVTVLVTAFMGLGMLSLVFPAASFLMSCPYWCLKFILVRIPSPAQTCDAGIYAALLLSLSSLLLAVHVAKPERNLLS